MAEAAAADGKRVSVSTSELEDSIQVDIQEVDEGDSKESKAKETMDRIAEFSGSSKTELIATDCPVKNVTVFLDQAEVNRLITVSLESKETEILVKGLPAVIDENSVRVQCYGDATIIEVQYKEIVKEVKKNESEETKRKKTEMEELRQKKEDLLKKMATLNTKTELVKKEKNLLEGYGNRLSGSASKTDRVVELFEKKTLENLTSFLDYFDDRSKKWDKSIADLQEEFKGLEKEIAAIDERLGKLVPESRIWEGASQLERCVSVLLEAPKAVEVKLVLSYVVYEAKWSPLYDLRAFSKDNVLQLLYFGIIQQTTGEDWNDTKIALSTALPSVGGSPPELQTQWLSIDHAIRSKGFARKSKRIKSHAPARGVLFGASRGMDEYDPTIEDSYCATEALAAALPTAEASEGITSTSFEIARPATIKCDSTGHKVSICQIDFTPQFEYQSVPKLVAHAFLKAKVKNQSQYALLAGPANVFLDNNFLTKSNLTAVSPLEEFDVSLGADPSVKVTYHPVKKFKQTSGILSKTASLSYHQVITIKNTKQRPITITVTDQLPKSSEEKIKVTLQQPELKITKQDPTGGKGPIHLNDKNNIEWVYDIPAGETKEINVKYVVEYPVNVNVQGL